MTYPLHSSDSTLCVCAASCGLLRSLQRVMNSVREHESQISRGLRAACNRLYLTILVCFVFNKLSVTPMSVPKLTFHHILLYNDLQQMCLTSSIVVLAASMRTFHRAPARTVPSNLSIVQQAPFETVLDYVTGWRVARPRSCSACQQPLVNGCHSNRWYE